MLDVLEWVPHLGDATRDGASLCGLRCKVGCTFDSVGSAGSARAAQFAAEVRLSMIMVGLVLLVIGIVAKIAVLSSIGVVVLVIGLIFVVASALGHAIGGRRHIF